MTTEQGPYGTGTNRLEHLKGELPQITPESLIQDNNSAESQRRMSVWHDNYRNGRITLLVRCSDARIVNPDPTATMTINAVAATEQFDQYANLLTEAPFSNIAFLGHFDSEQLRKLHSPKGCGAHDAWESVKNGNVQNPNGIFKRVVENLSSNDPALQVIKNAKELADYTSKSVLAMVQDQRTAENIPVGVVFSEGDSIHCVTPRSLLRLQDGLVEPQDVYWNGTIPRLRSAQIPSSFLGMLQKGEEQHEIRKNDQKFYDSQGIQNPQAVVLSVDFEPLETRFAQTFGDPNTAYRLLVPRRSTGERLTESAIETAIDHAEYPLVHAIKNYRHGGNFADTNTLFIETKKLGTSGHIAKRIAGTDFGAAFLNLSPDHQIIIGETAKGKLIYAETYK